MKRKLRKCRDQKGVAIVIVAGLTVMFVAFIALSVDIAHLYVVRNELQNAADAGALAGARRLYFPDGSAINPDANQIAYEAALMNNSERIAVEVNSPLTNNHDVQRGHWSFATQTFTADDGSHFDPPELWDVTPAELDADPTWINAVLVRTRRQSTQANSFFARILGFAGFNASAEAVAYIGFSGTILPGEVDQPIAICQQSILFDGEYRCNIGRMLNSGTNPGSHNTAGWTNFTQPCTTASDADMRALICSGGNPYAITGGIGVGTTGGVQDNTLRDLRDCFMSTSPNDPWPMALPVIDCPGNNVSNCATVLGVVHVNVVWISRNDAKNENQFRQEDWPPTKMGDWTCNPECWATSETPRECCWYDFVESFELKNVDGSPAEYAAKSIYFIPDCDDEDLTGRTGGAMFNTLAEIPVLVN